MSLMDLALASGERVWAASLHAQETYAHAYEGIPDHTTNDESLGHFGEVVERIFHGPFPVYIVEPARHVPDPPRTGSVAATRLDKLVAAGIVRGGVERLPKYWFAAEFYGGGMATCLAVIWFQDEPFPIPTDQARSQLEAIDWKRHAEEFTP